MKRCRPILTPVSHSRRERFPGLALLAACLFALSLAACGDDGSSPAASAPPADGAAAPSGPEVGTEVTSGPDGAVPDWCAPCSDDAAGAVECPALRPTTLDDLKVLCTAKLSAGWAQVTVSVGDCVPVNDMPGCSAGPADTDVDVLSFHLGQQGVDCHYARPTGFLLGKVISADSPHFCGSRAYVSSTSLVKNPWCQAGGATMLTVTCAI